MSAFFMLAYRTSSGKDAIVMLYEDEIGEIKYPDTNSEVGVNQLTIFGQASVDGMTGEFGQLGSIDTVDAWGLTAQAFVEDFLMIDPMAHSNLYAGIQIYLSNKNPSVLRRLN